MSKIGEEIQSLIDEIAKECESEIRIDGDVTVYELHEKTRLTLRRCREILYTKYIKGTLKRHKVNVDGKICYAYYR
jgi:CHAD domain-containing protein